MILFRYLAREVLTSMTAVTLVLLLVIVSSKFIRYLGEAAAGELSSSVLFALVGYRIPSFLELILPLGLFLGILLSHGRLWLENEMAVMNACGVGPGRIQLFTLGPAALVAVLVALMSLWLTPAGMQRVEQIFMEQEKTTKLEMLTPGQFQSLGRQRAVYVRDFEEGRKVALDLFLVEGNGAGALAVVTAARASQFVEPRSGDRFLLLRDGMRYEGVPGRADYREIRFAEYAFRLRGSRVRQEVSAAEALPTRALLGSDRPEHRAQLHWRLSLPLLPLVVALLAVPLARVNPRQGRWARMLPSILLYLAYVGLLSNARSRIDQGDGGVAELWLVHLAMLLVAANLHWLGGFWQRLFTATGRALAGLIFWRRAEP